MFGDLNSLLKLAKSYGGATGMHWETYQPWDGVTLHRLVAPAGIVATLTETYGGAGAPDLALTWQMRPRRLSDALLMLAIRSAEIFKPLVDAPEVRA